MEDRWTSHEGAPYPLGAHFIPAANAYNFALYSKHATRVTLLLYGAEDPVTPLQVRHLDPWNNKSGRVWHCRIPAEHIGDVRYYAYQVDGPRQPEAGQRFDPDKILLDPYARAVFFPAGFSRAAAVLGGANAGKAPLGILRAGRRPFDWTGDRSPRHAHDTVIYELHVRGFTQRANSGVAAPRRGTFAGLIDKIPYLKSLGITAVELLPVFQFDPQEGNYWGYMPLSFFAMHHAYGSAGDQGQQLDEFRALVKALHQADIEVILDVVYNHTTESDEHGPTYSFRGIDNTTYYLLESDRRRYRNDSGTGNVIHTANRYVQGMLLDSLRYWVREMHVDGFRFDLASLFTRASDGSINLDDPPIIAAIRGDPQLAGIRLIAEAWDMSSYQLGRTFPGISWLQWNGRFRDEVRSFVRGDRGRTGDLMRRLYGSEDLFPDTLEDAYHAYQSVNFVTCHDGFCLYDLLSYDHPHNIAGSSGSADGPQDNVSWNCGWEGDNDVPDEIRRLRGRQARNFMCLLLLANGTPMFVAGDEFLNTQRGNSNPYNQDNETTWLDWDRLAGNSDFFRFCRLMIAFRKAHPTLGRSRFWRDDIRWFGATGPVDAAEPRNILAFHLRGAAEGDQDIYVMVNAEPTDVEFAIQHGQAWQRVVDTALPTPDDICEPGEEAALGGLHYPVRARSVVVLLATAHG